MNADLRRVLAGTGYFPDGTPALGLELGPALSEARRGSFAPDARWRSPSSLTVYFKQQDEAPTDEEISAWRREIWNEGFAPLLWVISPERIDLYNGFGKPLREGDAQANLIRRFEDIDASLDAVDALAGRLAIETGRFWDAVPQVSRKTSVDQQLLGDLASLEMDLVDGGMQRGASQALIGRVIFTQYLLDREIVSASRLKKLTGHADLPSVLRNRGAAAELFAWLAQTFNGDMFPAAAVRTTPAASHLKRVADFLQAVDIESQQLSLFPYRFDIIPVELISSIYEQFAHADPSGVDDKAIEHGVHYTRLPLVSLVLDELMEDSRGTESVLDLTCGSGVFLVEAFRRLVQRRANGDSPTRELIRNTLHEQVFGVDISEAAIRVAAFSLYLAALELDPNPHPAHALRFRPLIGRNLLVGDARSIESTPAGKAALSNAAELRKFDLIIGNPPWTFRGSAGTKQRRAGMTSVPMAPRGEGLDFLWRASEFASPSTRFGLVLSAMPFLSRSSTGLAAAVHTLEEFAPVTLVSLAAHVRWLFPKASMPAVAFFARHRPKARRDMVTVVQVPWTPEASRTHTFEVAPSDVIKVPLVDVVERPLKLKAAAVGRRRDLGLLDRMVETHAPLGERLRDLGVQFRDGLTQGKPKKQTRNAGHLRGLEVMRAGHLSPFQFETDLKRYSEPAAQWPRTRETYQAPLLIVKEMVVKRPRLTVAVADRDVVFTDAFIGASFAGQPATHVHALAAVLSSSLATWFFGLTASEFGIYKPKLGSSDLKALPVPAWSEFSTRAAVRLAEIAKALRDRTPTADDWRAIDNATADFYGLDQADRLLLEGGLTRGSESWMEGRENGAAPADSRVDVAEYASAFTSVLDTWLAARNRRHARAEVLDLPIHAALRVVRFVLEDEPGRGGVDLVSADGDLNAVLDRIGARMNVRIATALTAARELRIHGRNEIIVIKPSRRRHWLPAEALDDADAVVAESLVRAAT